MVGAIHLNLFLIPLSIHITSYTLINFFALINKASGQMNHVQI